MLEKGRKITAVSVAAAALLAGGVVAGSAYAAEGDAAQPTITINAPQGQTLAGHSFNAYYLGAYGNLQADKDGNFTAATVASDANATAWVQAAINAVNSDKDDANNVAIKNGQDPVDALSRANAVAAHDVAELLKNTEQDRPAAVASDKSSETGSLTFDVPSEGWYAVTDSAGMTLLVGTTSNGKTVVGQSGTVTLKATTVTIHKQGDKNSVSVGHDIAYTATAILPEAKNVKTVTLTDTMAGMVLDGDVTVKVGDEDVTAKVTITKAENNAGFTADLSDLLADYGSQTATLTYNAKLTAADASNTLGVSWVDADGNPTIGGNQKVDAHAYRFDLTKVDAGDTNTVLKGAGFKIQAKDGAWQSYDAASGAWTDAADEAHATEFTTGDNGQVAFPGLGTGQYTVKETTVPAGHYKVGDVTFDATIADNGTVTFAGTGANNGLTARVDDGSVQVKNLSNISQLPQTGAFGDWTIAVGTIALLAAATGVGAFAVRRNKLAHDVEAPVASV